MDSMSGIIQEQAQTALRLLGAQDIVTAAKVADGILRRVAYWAAPMPNNEKLVFMRLFSPVVQREEVFLGNVLFNAFLSKAFPRAVANTSSGAAELVANDLDSYYFLVRTMRSMEELSAALRLEVERSLSGLFFGDPDTTQGIYGDLARMFAFRKSDFEPFPVYAIPEFLVPQFEKVVYREVSRLLAPDVFPDRVRTVLAALAFFYGRTSGGSGDAQSFSTFIEHLVNGEDYDGLLKATDVSNAFNIDAVNKVAIKQSVDDGTYSISNLAMLLTNLIHTFHSACDGGSDKWLMGFLRKDAKFVSLKPVGYLDILLDGIQLGYDQFPNSSASMGVPCRLCNSSQAYVEDRYVITGLNSFRFDNQSIRRQAQKVCAKCALHSYLAQKLLGTEMVSAGGKLPQVPKTYNLIFHYGRHSDQEVDHLTHHIDLVWSLVRTHRDSEQVRNEVASQARELKARYDREQNAQKKDILINQLSQKEAELQLQQAIVAKVRDDILAICPWLQEHDASWAPSDNCTLDVLANIQLSSTKVERHILGLGLSGYRMILFVLPQIRPPRDEVRDFAQRRFSDSWVTVTAMLSFLRDSCGCDGPFYYQSLPTLAPGTFQRDMFYVHNVAVGVQQAQDKYEVVTQLAWKLVKKRGSDGFVQKVVLAEKLLEDPLGTLAGVMRDSAILGQTKGSYKQLKVGYRKDWLAQDLTEYARFIQKLSKLQEVK